MRFYFHEYYLHSNDLFIYFLLSKIYYCLINTRLNLFFSVENHYALDTFRRYTFKTS